MLKRTLLLNGIRWMRWVLIPAVVAASLLAARPAFAAGLVDPIDDAIRGLNTAWVLVAGFLVFFMQAGFAFVEAGLTRSKNTVNILYKNLIDFVFATLAFWAFGYAFTQAPDATYGSVEQGLDHQRWLCERRVRLQSVVEIHLG